MAQDPTMNIAGNVNPEMLGSHGTAFTLSGGIKKLQKKSRQFSDDKRLLSHKARLDAELMTHGANINDWQQRRASGVDSDEELKAAGGLIGAGMRSAVAATRVMGPNGEVIQLGGDYKSGAGVNVSVGGHAPIAPKEAALPDGGVVPPSGPHPNTLGPQMEPVAPETSPAKRAAAKRSGGLEGRVVSSEGQGVRVEQKKVGLKDVKERVAQAGRGVPLVTDAQKEIFKHADMTTADTRPTSRGSRHWQATPRGQAKTRAEALESERPAPRAEERDYADIGPKAEASVKSKLESPAKDKKTKVVKAAETTDEIL